LEATQFLQRKYDLSMIIQRQPLYIRWTAYYLFIAMILFCGVFGNKQFIYFQF
jgi:alginate O-acetyltransferase complex protein AlgI